ncbi:MAG: hypothetical protein ACPGSP_02550 [Alphaproteobacteria bacterium]
MVRVGAALLFLLLSLAGCGFQPQLRDSTGQYDIGIPSIAGRDGQVLRAALVQRLNRFEQPQNPLYALELQLSVDTDEVLALNPRACLTDGRNCSWSEVEATARFQIRTTGVAGSDQAEAIVWQGFARGRSDQRRAQTGWRFGSAAEEARTRALLQLADDLALQVSVALSRP